MGISSITVITTVLTLTTTTMCWSSRRRTAGLAAQDPAESDASSRSTGSRSGSAVCCWSVWASSAGRSPARAGFRWCCSGLAIWSSEFEWANRLMHWFKLQLASGAGRGASRCCSGSCSSPAAACSPSRCMLVAGIPGWVPPPASEADCLLAALPGRCERARISVPVRAHVCARGGGSKGRPLGPLMSPCGPSEYAVLRCAVRRLRPPRRRDLPTQPAPGEHPARLRRGRRARLPLPGDRRPRHRRRGTAGLPRRACSTGSPIGGRDRRAAVRRGRRGPDRRRRPHPPAGRAADGLSRRPVQHRRQVQRRRWICWPTRSPSTTRTSGSASASFGVRRLHRLRRRLGRRVASAASPLGVALNRFVPWLTRVLNTPAPVLQIPLSHPVLRPAS